jgi:hypothetical protein
MEDIQNGEHPGQNDREGDGQYPNPNPNPNPNPADSPRDWRAALPPELQPMVQKYDDLTQFVRAYGSARELIGKKFEDLSHRDFQAWSQMMNAATGVPPSPDEYQIDPLPQSGGNPILTREESTEIRELAHAMGLDNEHAQILHDAFSEVGERILDSHQGEIQARYEECMSDLAQSWGNAYESKIQAIDNVIENVLPQLTGLSSDAIREELEQSRIYNSPTLLKVLAAVGELSGNTASRGYSDMAPGDARTRFEQLRSDPEFVKARINPHHPMHRQVKEEFEALCVAVNNGR